jgi:hypothetical protein
MILPNFYLIGGQKCGTHWISHQLIQHSQVFIPEKELHFFDTPGNYMKGLSYYSQFFNDARDYLLIGERTPNYMAVASVAEKISRVTPGARFIVTFRNPLERALSSYCHHVPNRRYSPLRNINDIFEEILRTSSDPYGMITFGNYDDQINEYFKFFKKDKFFIIIFEEDILVHKTETLKRLCSFLGVNYFDELKNVHTVRNKGVKTKTGLLLSYLFPGRLGVRMAIILEKFLLKKKIHLSQRTAKKLYDYYLPGIERLEVTIDRDLSVWKNKMKALL